jgi:hypothetical protein
VGKKVSLFVDGVPYSSFALSKEKNNIEKFFINTNFSGQLQDIRIYGFALSKKQISAIFNNGKISLEKELSDGQKKFSPVNHFIIKQQASE